MEQYLLDDLNSNEDRSKICLLHIHHLLSNCTTYINQGSYEITFQGLYQDFYFGELLKREWGYQYISSNTIDLLLTYHLEWKKYVNEKSFGDSFFIFYDPKWQIIILDLLIPALRSMESDFKNNNVNDPKYQGTVKFTKIDEYFQPYSKPSDAEILWKVTNIYQLMRDKKLIEIPYMGEDI